MQVRCVFTLSASRLVSPATPTHNGHGQGEVRRDKYTLIVIHTFTYDRDAHDDSTIPNTNYRVYKSCVLHTSTIVNVVQIKRNAVRRILW